MSTQPAVDLESHAKPKLVRIIARLNVGGPARQACLLQTQLKPVFDCRLIIGELTEGEHDMSYLLCSEQDVNRLATMRSLFGPMPGPFGAF